MLFVVKVLTGQMTEVNDVREYDEDLKEKKDTNDQMSTEGYAKKFSSRWLAQVYSMCM